uniref:Major facilitator superfamily associated domain-containing protein n=1 Tax=Ciona savignyi TaxID=51511 RepID=H2ZEQ4_CIOSA
MARFNRQIQWDVRRSGFIANVFYFLFAGGKACLFPFLTLYFRHLGLSATQVGIVCALKYLIWYFAAPVWIALARRLDKIRIVLCTTLLLAVASNLAVTVVPPANTDLFNELCSTNNNINLNATLTSEISIVANVSSTTAIGAECYNSIISLPDGCSSVHKV